MEREFHSPAEVEINRWIDEVTPEVIASANMKLELGMATPEEQATCAALLHKMRDLINSGGFNV